MSSFVGILGYIFTMSKEASFVPCSYGMSHNSFRRCIGFLTLKALGNGMYNCIILLRYLASLYAGAPFQLTIGHMGQSALCTFGSLRVFGAVGFILVSFLLLFLGSMDWQDFIAIPTLL